MFSGEWDGALIMRIRVLVNERAGTALGSTPEDIRALIGSILGADGHEATVDFISPDRLIPEIDAALASDIEALIIGGGDGTINAAATRLMNSDKALGIIPLGTMNRLARDLGLPIDAKQAVEALSEARVKHIDMGEVNGHYFTCNSFIGIPPRMTAQRQNMRGKPFGERMRGYLGVVRKVVASRKRMALRIDDGTRVQSVRALSVAVSNGPYAEVPTLIWPKRETLDTGELGLYVSKHRSVLGIGWIMAKALVGKWRTDDPNFYISAGKDITIASKRTNVRVANDGELELLQFPLRYKIHPQVLKVLVPQSAA